MKPLLARGFRRLRRERAERRGNEMATLARRAGPTAADALKKPQTEVAVRRFNIERL